MTDPVAPESIRFVGGRVVTQDGVLDGADVTVAEGVITAIGETGRAATTVDLAGRFLLPGLVDLHVHGGGGFGFDAGTADMVGGLAAQRRHGTTRSMISLVTGPPESMLAAVRDAAALADTDPRILGIHLEGPFLAPSRCGAHDPALLREPDPELLDRLIDAGGGHVRMVTLAPELTGGLELIRHMIGRGVHAAVGHSDAGYEVAAAAFAAGADLVTHAFNGMHPLHHRDPAIIGAAMDAGVVMEAINDGHHLHDATVRLLHRIAPGRLVLITDAMAAAAVGDGDYRLGALDVAVRGGVARLANGSIAGSTLTLDVAVQRAVFDVGLPLTEAVLAASLLPARWLGVEDRFGDIAAGLSADVVVADPELHVQAVLSQGTWVDERRP